MVGSFVSALVNRYTKTEPHFDLELSAGVTYLA